MVEPVSIRVMKGGVTAKPWAWSSWMDVLRREALDRTYQQRRRILLQQYSDLGVRDWRLRPPETKQIRHIIRIDPGMLQTPPPGWERQIVRSWRPWHYEPDVTHIKLDPHPTSTGVTREAAGWWEGAGRGLPLGAALLAAILLLLRAADRCLHTNLFKLPIRRRQSEEWPTPNVTATSLAVRVTSDFSSIRPPSPPTTQSGGQVDLPPPYSECATGDAADATVTSSRPKTEHEEPPPPYSACYVAYSNPKDGPPSVHIFTQQCQSLFENYEPGPSSVHDTGQSTDEDLSREDRGLNREDTRAVEDVGVLDNVLNDGMVYSENTDNESDAELKEATPFSRERYLVV